MLPKPNFFVRHPTALGGAGAHQIPSVGAFDLAPGGAPAQAAAIEELLKIVLEAACSYSIYDEESGMF